jgi:aspartate kinase
MNAVLGEIRDCHLDIIQEGIVDPNIAADCKNCIERELDRLKSFLEAVELIGEVSDRSLDRIVATGEVLAVHVCSSFLKDQASHLITIQIQLN